MEFQNTPYVTVEEATTYFTFGRMYGDAWLNSTPEIQQSSLNHATTLILACFVFQPGTLEQEADPVERTGKLLRAICDQALWIINNPTAVTGLALLTKGFSQASAGSLSITLSKEFKAELIDPVVIAELDDIAEFDGDSDGWHMREGLTSGV